MEFNECDTCHAKDGRAGMLIGGPGIPSECGNCRDTRERGQVVVHTNLKRTEEEIQRTMAILDEEKS
jgi:hypothetical protein